MDPAESWERPQRTKSRPPHLKDYECGFLPRIDLLEGSSKLRSHFHDLSYAEETLRERFRRLQSNIAALSSLSNLGLQKSFVGMEAQRRMEDAIKAEEALVQCRLQLAEKKFLSPKSIASSSVELSSP